MCFKAAGDATLARLKWDPEAVITGAVLLLIGYFLFRWRRGKSHAQDRASEEFLWGIGPLVIFAIGLFIFNCIRLPYLVYRAEHEKAEQLVRQADTRADLAEQEKKSLAAQLEKTKPQLQPKIDSALVGPAGDKENAIVGIIGKIENLGAPGTVEEFWIDLKFDDGRVLKGEIAGGPENTQPWYFGKNVQGQKMYMRGSEYFTNKRSEIIPTYGHLDGFLMALVRDVTKEEILTKKATIIFTCRDVTGTKHSTEASFGAGTPGPDALGLGGLQKHIPKH
jgi:hypothetical protein